jgi:hypothetical protein
MQIKAGLGLPFMWGFNVADADESSISFGLDFSAFARSAARNFRGSLRRQNTSARILKTRGKTPYFASRYESPY